MARTRQHTPNDLALVQAPLGTPLHLRVRRTVEDFIASGIWPTGARIPSSRQIAEQLGVSRTTVQVAYDGLLEDGFIVAKPRSGYFVHHQINAVAVDEFTSSGVRADRAAIDWAQMASSTDPVLPELDREPRWWAFEYPFVTGQHDPAHFPAAAWMRALKASLGTDEHRHASLDDVLVDDPLLVATICEQILPARGIFTEPDNVLITLGSQQGLQLLAESLLQEGDTAVVESPGYLGRPACLLARGHKSAISSRRQLRCRPTGVLLGSQGGLPDPQSSAPHQCHVDGQTASGFHQRRRTS